MRGGLSSFVDGKAAVKENGPPLSFLAGPHYQAAMDKLTTEQARKLTEAVRPMGGYLFRVQARMEKTNLGLGDPRLYQLVTTAYDALHGLWVELHYQSGGHGGRAAAGGEVNYW